MNCISMMAEDAILLVLLLSASLLIVSVLNRAWRRIDRRADASLAEDFPSLRASEDPYAEPFADSDHFTGFRNQFKR